MKVLQPSLLRGLFVDKPEPWATQHNAAISVPLGQVPLGDAGWMRVGSEQAWLAMAHGWKAWAEAYRICYGSRIGDDQVLGPAWAQIGACLADLLNASVGRLDCGTCWKWVDETLRRHGIDNGVEGAA